MCINKEASSAAPVFELGSSYTVQPRRKGQGLGQERACRPPGSSINSLSLSLAASSSSSRPSSFFPYSSLSSIRAARRRRMLWARYFVSRLSSSPASATCFIVPGIYLNLFLLLFGFYYLHWIISAAFNKLGTDLKSIGPIFLLPARLRSTRGYEI